MEKISTGIEGLDQILHGGIGATRSVLVTGVPGTGKTLLGMHFILQGAEASEPGLFITYEECESSILQSAQSFGFKLEDHLKSGMITLVNQDVTTKIMTFKNLIDTIKQRRIKRVFLDSITLFEYTNSPSNKDTRREILEFIKTMKSLGVTLMGTSEKQTDHLDGLVYSQEDFLFEGLIVLTKIRKGATFERCITVTKMRGQEHLLGIYPFIINPQGMFVYPQQIPFSLIEKGDNV